MGPGAPPLHPGVHKPCDVSHWELAPPLLESADKLIARQDIPQS